MKNSKSGLSRRGAVSRVDRDGLSEEVMITWVLHGCWYRSYRHQREGPQAPVWNEVVGDQSKWQERDPVVVLAATRSPALPPRAWGVSQAGVVSSHLVCRPRCYQITEWFLRSFLLWGKIFWHVNEWHFFLLWCLLFTQACFASLVSQDYVNGTDQEEIRTGKNSFFIGSVLDISRILNCWFYIWCVSVLFVSQENFSRN